MCDKNIIVNVLERTSHIAQLRHYVNYEFLFYIYIYIYLYKYMIVVRMLVNW